MSRDDCIRRTEYEPKQRVPSCPVGDVTLQITDSETPIWLEPATLHTLYFLFSHAQEEFSSVSAGRPLNVQLFM